MKVDVLGREGFELRVKASPCAHGGEICRGHVWYLWMFVEQLLGKDTMEKKDASATSRHLNIYGQLATTSGDQ